MIFRHWLNATLNSLQITGPGRRGRLRKSLTGTGAFAFERVCDSAERLEDRRLLTLLVSQIEVAFNDPGGNFTSFYPAITDHTKAAGAAWGEFLDVNPAATIQVLIGFDPGTPTATGGSTITRFLGTQDGLDIFEQGMTDELRTGIDPNGATQDVDFTFGTSYLEDDLWFDPDPFARLESVSVPADRVDAQSVFLHEFGHAIFMNGFHDETNGTLPGNSASPFDAFVVFDGQNLFFTGSEAVSNFGANVPLTFGNSKHVGNAADSGRPGSDLVPDLMNGVVFELGTRYDISALDLAILADTQNVFDFTAPTADILDVSPDPRATNAGVVTINFSESVTGVDIGDFTLTRDTTEILLTGLTVSGTGSSRTIDLSGVTELAGIYTLTLNGNGAGILDGSGNELTGSVLDTWVVVEAAPVVTAELIDDPDNAGEMILLITGTTGDDNIRLRQGGTGVVVRANGRPLGRFESMSRIVIDASAGNDIVRPTLSVRIPMEVDGGDGDDVLFGSRVDDVLVGGIGNDRLVGRRGNDRLEGGAGNDGLAGNAGDDVLDGGAGTDNLRGGRGNDLLLGSTGNDVLRGDIGNDVLIGGDDIDQLRGGIGQDILIGGTVTLNSAALTDLLAAWTTNESYQDRTTSLASSTLQAGQTVVDDGDRDRLFGNSSLDWFFTAENIELEDRLLSERLN